MNSEQFCLSLRGKQEDKQTENSSSGQRRGEMESQDFAVWRSEKEGGCPEYWGHTLWRVEFRGTEFQTRVSESKGLHQGHKIRNRDSLLKKKERQSRGLEKGLSG